MKNNLLLRTGLVFLLIFGIALAHPKRMHAQDNSANKLIIAGTGDSQELLRAVARAFEAHEVGSTVEVPDSIGTSGGMQALIKGKCDLARTARPLNENENKPGITYHLFAKTPVVFVINPSVTGIDNVTSEQVNGIYSGAIIDWSQLGAEPGKIYAINREPGDSALAVLLQKLMGFKEIENPVGNIAYTTQDAVNLVAKHKQTICFVPFAAVREADVTILKLDGVPPSDENISSGAYKLYIPLGIAHKEDVKARGKKIIAFLYSEEAKEIMKRFGAVPVL